MFLKILHMEMNIRSVIILLLLVLACHASYHNRRGDNAENFKRSKRRDKHLQNFTITRVTNLHSSQGKINLSALEISRAYKLKHMGAQFLNSRKAPHARFPAEATISKHLQVKISRRKRDKSMQTSSNGTRLSLSTTQKASSVEDWLTFPPWSKLPIVLSPLSETNEWKTYRSLFPTKTFKRLKWPNTSMIDIIAKEEVVTGKPIRIKKPRLQTRYGKRNKVLKKLKFKNETFARRFDLGDNLHGRANWFNYDVPRQVGQMIPGVNIGIPRQWEYESGFDRLRFNDRRDFPGWMRGDPGWGPGFGPLNRQGPSQRAWSGRSYENWAKYYHGGGPRLGTSGVPGDPGHGQRVWPRRNFEGLVRGKPMWRPGFGPGGRQEGIQRAWPDMNPGMNWGSGRGSVDYLGQRAWPVKHFENMGGYPDWFDKTPEVWRRGDPGWGPGFGPVARLGDEQRAWFYKNSENYPNGLVRYGSGPSAHGEQRAWSGPHDELEDRQNEWFDKDSNNVAKVNQTGNHDKEMSNGLAGWRRGDAAWGRGYGPQNNQSDASKIWSKKVIGDWVGDNKKIAEKLDQDSGPDYKNWVGGGPKSTWKDSFGARLDNYLGDLDMRYHDKSWNDPDWSQSQSKVENPMNKLEDPRYGFIGRPWSRVNERPIWGRYKLKDDSNEIDMQRIEGQDIIFDEKQIEAVNSSILQGRITGGAYRVLTGDPDKERKVDGQKQIKSSSTPKVTKSTQLKYDDNKVGNRSMVNETQEERQNRESSRKKEFESDGIRQMEDIVEGDEQDIQWSDLTSSDSTIWRGLEGWNGNLEVKEGNGDILRGVTPLDRNSKDSLRYLMGRCYTCGLNESGIPIVPRCYDAFDNEDRRFIGRRPKLQTNCHRGSGVESSYHKYSSTFIGGCFKRFTDIGGIYYEKGCRSWPPTVGRTVASVRFARLEELLEDAKDECVFSPNAVLTPFARGISLWVRYHVCVCRGDYCNAQCKIQLAPSTFLFSILAITLNNIWHIFLEIRF